MEVASIETSRLAAHLSDEYAVQVAKVSAIEGGHLYCVELTSGPKWVARPFPPDRPVERVDHDAAILRHLEEVGYPAERSHDRPVSMFDGWTILVTTFVEGHLPGRGGRSKVPLRTFEALGALLGRLHTEPLPDALRRPAGSWHGDASFEGSPAEDIAAIRAWLADSEPQIATHGRKALETLVKDLDTLDDAGDLPHAFVHPDFVPVNSIVAPDGGHVIVDWTGSGWGPRVASFSNLVAFTVGDQDGSTEDRVRSVVNGYREHLRLEPDELNRLAGVLRTRTLLFASLIYRSSVKSGYTPVGTEPWWPDYHATDELAALVQRIMSDG